MSPSSPVACWISSLLRATSRSRCRAPLRPVLTAGPARGQIRTRNGRRWGHRLHSKKTATLSLRYVNAESTPGVHAVHKLGHPLTQNSFPSRRSPGVTGALDMAPMFLSMPARGARWGPSGALSLLVMDSTQPASLWYRGGGVGVSRPLGGCRAVHGGGAARGGPRARRTRSILWGQQGARPFRWHPGSLRGGSRLRSRLTMHNHLAALGVLPTRTCCHLSPRGRLLPSVPIQGLQRDAVAFGPPCPIYLQRRRGRLPRHA